MQQRNMLCIIAVAALFTALTLTTGCGSKRAASSQQQPIFIDSETQLDVPRLRQSGTRNNCGPTSAAMVLGAYRGTTSVKDLKALRNALGTWSFSNYAMRRLRLPGIRGGMTPETVLIDTLNEHSGRITFDSLDPEQTYLRKTLTSVEQAHRALQHLKDAIVDRRPVLALVQSGILWPDSSESLHWVVVTGISEDKVAINDPADGNSDVFSVDRFMRGWRLNPFFRTLPIVHSYGAIVGDEPLPNHEAPEPVHSEPLDFVSAAEEAEITALASRSACPDKSVLRCK